MQLALWHEIRESVDLKDVGIGSLCFLVSAFISSENLENSEVYFIILAFIGYAFVMLLKHKQTFKNESETSSGRDAIQSDSKTGHQAGNLNAGSIMNPTENPLVEDGKRKRIPFSSIPFSRSMGLSSQFPI